ncbi:MAG: hypothetical protein QOJ11_2134 [Frankiales bacterium]|jgi:hypothetical protein|nr:hypothetical protein [Frankiales bacterium]
MDSGTSRPGVIISTRARRHRLFRAPARLLVAAVTALSLMSAVPAHAAGHPATSHLSATATPLTVLPHNTVTVAGTVTPRGTGVVMLQRYSAGRWVQVAHKPTSASGSYSFAIKTSATLGTSIYRVTRAASSAAKAVISKTMHVHVVKTAYKVKNVARPAVPSATPIVVTGSVSPKVKGTVRLEVLQHGAWHAIASAKLSAASTYSLSKVEPTGVYALRVRSPLTATIASGVGRTVKVTVAAPPAAPTVAVSLAGKVVSAGVYSGTVVATATTTAPAGVKTLTYSLDNGPTKPYTAGLSVSAPGTHTLKLTLTDNANRTVSASRTWSISALKDITLPKVSVTLAGTQNGGGVYTTDVTVTLTTTAGSLPIGSLTYALDGAAATPYTAPFVVQSLRNHTLQATVTDSAGNIGVASASWSQTSAAPDTTAPDVVVTPIGTTTDNGMTYKGTVQVKAVATDDGGINTLTYRLDSGPETPYTDPFNVTALTPHTVTFTATDFAGNIGTATKAWTQIAGTSMPLVISSTDQTTLGLATPRLVFSSYRGGPAALARQFTLSNVTSTPIQINGLAISGANAGNFQLAAGQPTSFPVPGGGSALVSIEFHPSDPTGCPVSSDPLHNADIGNVNQVASLTVTTDQPSETTATADLAGVNACYFGGNNEPVLDQILAGLGYDENTPGGYQRRFIGPSRWIGGTDEVISPYFSAADPSQPVSLVPVAHYGTGSTSGDYQTTGWYAKGAAMTLPRSTCSAACTKLFAFPADFAADSFNQNQKLLPTPSGATSFTPAGAFGLFSGDFTDVNFSDDALNLGHQNSGTGHTPDANLPVAHYLHDMRIYAAYGPGRVRIPNTYIVAIDLSRVPAYKNNDFQDVVLLLSNAMPATGQGRVLSGAGDTVDLTSGISVDQSNCSVTGFDGVMANTAGDQCVGSHITTSAQGLVLTSDAGQLAEHSQKNALYQSFDATRGAFTITTQVIGSTNQLASNYQQIAAFFGPDQNNFIKLEAEHNGSPGLTLFYVENGVGGTVTSVAPTGLTTASTLDLVIKGNTTVPDPVPYGDEYGVHGFPLDQLTVWYSINGGTLTQIGPTIKSPANVTGWFSRTAKAGILVANPGPSAPPITATFSKFAITTG